MRQLDIYGNEVPLEEIEPKVLEKQGGRITLKSHFRNCYGFRQGFYCKNCKYFKSIVRSGVTYYKCEKMGTSYSSATDIRKNDIACILYEVKNNKTY